MDNGTHHNVSFPSSASLPNLLQTNPSDGYCGDWKGCLLTHRSLPSLLNQLTCINKIHGTRQNQSSAPWTEVHTIMCYFYPVRFAKSAQKLAQLLGATGSERDASWNVTHAPGLSIQYHTSTSQMECASSNHQLRWQRYTPWCIISAQCLFAKSSQNQPICSVLWGLKGMPPDTQVMPQACQSIDMHP